MQDFEIIIIDDASTDNSREIIEEYRSNKKISHIVLNEKNSGSLLAQWNKGIGLARGEWIWIAESDDIADPAFLEECASYLNRNPLTGLWYSDSQILDEETQRITNRFSNRKNSIFRTQKWDSVYFNNGINEINEFLKYDCTVNNVSAAVFRKELARGILQQPVRLRYYPDWYFFLQLCLHTDIGYSPRPLNTYRFHTSSNLNAQTSLLTSKKEYFQILKLLYYNKKVTEKKKLLAHHSFNYLSFGILEDGFANMIRIIKSYWAMDKKLAIKVVLKIFLIKLFYQRYRAKFELTDKQTAGSKPF